jgi:hypothetical protein
VPNHVISITNNGNESVTYSFNSINAATAYALPNATGDIAAFPPALDTATPVTVSLSPLSVTVEPGDSANLTAVFSLNDQFNQSLIPVYSGYIVVSSSAPSDGGSLNIPFMGVAANLSTLDLFDTTSIFPSVTPDSIDPQGAINDSTLTTFSMVGGDTPVFNVALRFPTQNFRLDVVAADSSTPPNSTFAGLGILGYFSR